jgi:processive 1,2-diacylglycerol beta-glucosyltransferase
MKAVGYTDEMDEFMAASDLVVGKPGGLTTAEALAYKIDRLLDDSSRFTAMKARSLQLGCPDAAKEIVAKLPALKAGYIYFRELRYNSLQ